jgi:hypothetical protein
MLICVPALAVMGTSHDVLILRCAMAVYGVASWLYLANLWAGAFDVVDPAARSTAIGLLNVASGVLGAWVSPLIGRLRETGMIEELGSVFVASAVTSLVAALLVALMIRLYLHDQLRGMHDYRSYHDHSRNPSRDGSSSTRGDSANFGGC